MPKHGKRPAYWASTAASANWRYITDEDRAGPRKNEIMFSTTEAKKSFALETSDISTLTGLRHPQSGYRSGSTLTMYYHGDLVALSVKKWGQVHFDEKVPAGRKQSGAEAREQAERDQEAAVNRLVNDPYSVVPADRLTIFKLHRLQAMVVRLEGGKQPPWPGSKEAAVSRIIVAGYSEAAEAAHMAQQRVVDERLEAERAIRVAEAQKKHAEEAAKEAAKKAARETAAKARKATREQAFAAGELKVEDLNYQEMVYQAMALASAGFDKGYATGKERMGLKKAEVLEILKFNLEEKRKRSRTSLEALAEANLAEANLAESAAEHGAAHRAELEPDTKKARTEAVAARPAALRISEQAGGAGDFEACKRFEGPRAGYAFKSGPRGVGYYRDGAAGPIAEAKREKQSSAPPPPAPSKSPAPSKPKASSSSSASAAATAVPAVSVKPAERKVAHTPLTSAGQGAVSKVAQPDIRSFFGNK